MPTSAFVVTVPAAESLVGTLRDRFDASAKLGVPAHITVLFPFMPPEDITPDILDQAQAALSAVPSFGFSLANMGRFPTTAYLSPTPAEPFIALTVALTKCFPTVRRNPARVNIETYRSRLEQKQYAKRWPRVVIIP